MWSIKNWHFSPTIHAEHSPPNPRQHLHRGVPAPLLEERLFGSTRGMLGRLGMFLELTNPFVFQGRFQERWRMFGGMGVNSLERHQKCQSSIISASCENAR